MCDRCRELIQAADALESELSNRLGLRGSLPALTAITTYRAVKRTALAADDPKPVILVADGNPEFITALESQERRFA